MTDSLAVKKKDTFECHARRHMSGAVYKTYDAMLAMALSKEFDEEGNEIPRIAGAQLIFRGRISPTLANHTNSAPDQLADHIAKLCELKWLKKGRRVSYGSNKLGHYEYEILTHKQYEATYGGCPDYKYVQKKDTEAGIRAGDKVGPKGKQPDVFAMQNKLRQLGKEASEIFGCEVTFKRGAGPKGNVD